MTIYKNNLIHISAINIFLSNVLEIAGCLAICYPTLNTHLFHFQNNYLVFLITYSNFSYIMPTIEMLEN